MASILSVIIVSLAVPAFAGDEADLKKATDQFDATYLEGFNKRDPALMASHWTADAIMVTPRGLLRVCDEITESIDMEERS
jgi:hypothetical protein